MTEMEPKPKTRNWTRILLILSLALNLLVAGAFVGARFSDRKGPVGKEMAGQGQFLGPYSRAFSKEDRAALARSLVSRSGKLREKRGEMRAIGQELVAALRATPFDGEAVREVLTRQRAVQIALQDEGQDVFIERLIEMTPEARATFATNLEQGLKRGRKWR